MKDLLIIGAGSLGCLFGAKLAQLEYNINLVVSPRVQKIIQSPEFHLIESDKTYYKISNFNIIRNLNQLENTLKFCILSCKAFDLERLCQQYQSFLKNMDTIILLQNGLGNEEVIHTLFPEVSIFRLITSHGAMLTIDGLFHTGVGPTYLCEYDILSVRKPLQLSIEMQDFFNCMRNSEFKLTFAENPQEIIWRKAFINIGINAIGALTRLPNGQILKTDGMDRIITDTVKEAILIAKQLHIPMVDNYHYVQTVFDVISHTAQNKNSMLQDILNKKSTEIDFLNGKIVEYGKKLGIATPYNLILTSLIKGLEKSNRI